MIELIASILGGGGVIYLLVDKLLTSRKEKADAEQTIMNTVSQFIKDREEEGKEERAELRGSIADLTKKMNRLNSVVVKLYELMCCRENCPKRTKSIGLDDLLADN